VNSKQGLLASNINIITGTIESGNITGRTNTTITAPTITTGTNLLYGSTNVETKISSIETSLNTKQATLISTSNIITGTIESGNITGRTNTTIIAPSITASGNLLYGTTNVATKIGQLETALNEKQESITNANLTNARTNGLQYALDETAKLASANVFTTSQEIVGNLKANIVQVAITTPTINTHLTSNYM
jgi:hypothetical protein